MTTRTEPEGTSSWTWGSSTAAHNIGRLAAVAGPGLAESYTYDGLGRLTTRSITSDATYQYDYAYDEHRPAGHAHVSDAARTASA